MSARRPTLEFPDLLGLSNRFLKPRVIPGRREEILRVLGSVGVTLAQNDQFGFYRKPLREAMEALAAEGFIPESWAEGGLRLNPSAYTADRMDFFYDQPTSVEYLVRLAELAPIIPSALALAREAGHRISAIHKAPDVVETTRGSRGKFVLPWLTSLDVVGRIDAFTPREDEAELIFDRLHHVIDDAITEREAVEFWRRYVQIDPVTLEALRESINANTFSDVDFNRHRSPKCDVLATNRMAWSYAVGSVSDMPTSGHWNRHGWVIRASFLWALMACSPRKKLRPKNRLVLAFDPGDRTFASTPNPFAPLASLMEMGLTWTCRLVPDLTFFRPTIVVGLPESTMNSR